ncbi:sialomucin core protein 24-like [Mizuhopecten yessoensis]|uniref:Sialomucin core protein 24 n=1 Tax=Mizuhopecten yessoensis TaxID=6573 RepID=A0A210QWT7_MIZYE|nr:sialomucin core protein 24-like [Mizuhopecten yessoensis]OWF53174.1 Sialomucin core protein 24 [Mizuhopecten yessoensis]
MNQIVLVPAAILSIILLLSAPIAVETADACTANTNATSCCAVSSCGWFECLGNSANVTVCLNQTDTTAINTTCSNSTEVADRKSKCEAPIDSCSLLTDNTTCCGNATCGWYQCKVGDTLTGDGQCVSNTTSTLTNCTAPNTPQDTCVLPGTPTPAPIDTCTSEKTNDTCCNITGNACMWINCTGTEVCMASTASKETCTVKDNLCGGASTPSPIITTPAPTTPAPAPTTPAPTTPAPAPTPASNTGMQHFDGASFVGGIILAVGVIAIAFFGCKFYKARKERNYHTL